CSRLTTGRGRRRAPRAVPPASIRYRKPRRYACSRLDVSAGFCYDRGKEVSSMMTKGELRRARKQAGAEWWHVTENGRPAVVRVRTRREELRHQARMYRLARLTYDYDRDF